MLPTSGVRQTYPEGERTVSPRDDSTEKSRTHRTANGDWPGARSPTHANAQRIPQQRAKLTRDAAPRGITRKARVRYNETDVVRESSCSGGKAGGPPCSFTTSDFRRARMFSISTMIEKAMAM